MKQNHPTDKECTPCRVGMPSLTGTEINELKRKLEPRWQVKKNHHLERTFTFPDFREALNFTNQVGELAEEVNHHPNMELGWGWVKVIIWTHKANGLTENDFIFAARTDRLFPE